MLINESNFYILSLLKFKTIILILCSLYDLVCIISHIGFCSVCDVHFHSFKIYVLFVACILFYLEHYVRGKPSLSCKTLVKSTTCILFQLKHCSWYTISYTQDVHNVCDTHSYYITLCTLQYLLRIVHIITTKFFHLSLR